MHARRHTLLMPAAALGVMLIAALLLAACGGSSGAATATDPSASASADTANATTATGSAGTPTTSAGGSAATTSGAGTPAPSGTSTGSSTTATGKGGSASTAKASQIRECLRSHGVELPLPTGASPTERQKLIAALRECAKLTLHLHISGPAKPTGKAPSTTPAPNTQKPSKAAVAFRTCMRENGIPMSETANGKGGAFGGADTRSPAFQKALSTCFRRLQQTVNPSAAG